MKNIQHIALFLLFAIPLKAQIGFEGYVFESNNRGYLNQVSVSVFELPQNTLRGTMETGPDGHFFFSLPEGIYRITASKDIFFENSDTISMSQDKVFHKIELRRRPGYLFDATLAELRESPDQIVDAIQGATIEIYNRTTKQPVFVLKDAPGAFFQFTFERGNHYTMLIRKEGFLAKRIEVYVNVNGCIICVDGVRDVAPGVVDNLAAGHEEGTLLANIELDRARLDKRIQIQNIYYDFDKWDIRADAAERLDHVVTLMKDNPGISVELGSHTDTRGNDEYNRTLSQRRAAAAVAYIVSEGVDSSRITAKGYGESQLVNRCRNGVDCSEEEHQQNRRTELRITGISEKMSWKSLQDILEEEPVGQVSKKGKPTPQQRQKEANTSVPLPAFRPEEAVDATAPAPRNNEGFGISWQGESTTRILQMPLSFKGYAVELARSETELPPNHPSFKGHTEVFRLLENDGVNSYFLVNLGPRDAATSFYKKKIKPTNRSAKLVLFSPRGKEYID